MQYLVFQLQGAMASWGEAAVGEYRGSHDYPGASAVAGLLAAALGLRREQEAELQALHAGYLIGVGVYNSGILLRDYQTIQVPGRSLLKGQRHVTRKDELSFRRSDLNTILSTRDHRQDADHVIVVQAKEDAPYSLDQLQQALMRPVFVLYLGRKSCPPSAPLKPSVMNASSLLEALEAYRRETGHEDPRPAKVAWADGMEAGMPADLSWRRKDRLIHRGAWQYGDRTEHLAVLQAGGQ